MRQQVRLRPVPPLQPEPTGVQQVVQAKADHGDEHQPGRDADFAEDFQVGVMGPAIQVPQLAIGRERLGIAGGRVVQGKGPGA
ncbi:hypothetical protein D3C84_1099490 [compost metagenome]